MPRKPEQSDPEIEIMVEELSCSMETSGMHKLCDISGHSHSEFSKDARFTAPPPTSHIAKRSIPFSEQLDPVDDDNDNVFELPFPITHDDPEVDYSDNSLRPTVPPGKEYIELIQSETRVRGVNDLSTPPVQALSNSYTLPELPFDEWECSCEKVFELFTRLGVDLQPLVNQLHETMSRSNELYYAHKLIVTVFVLREAICTMNAYLVEGKGPNPTDQFCDFFAAQLNKTLLRESLYPSETSSDSFVKDGSYDTFQQIHTLMKPVLDRLELILADYPLLETMYRITVFNWQLRKL